MIMSLSHKEGAKRRKGRKACNWGRSPQTPKTSVPALRPLCG